MGKLRREGPLKSATATAAWAVSGCARGLRMPGAGRGLLWLLSGPGPAIRGGWGWAQVPLRRAAASYLRESPTLALQASP